MGRRGLGRDGNGYGEEGDTVNDLVSRGTAASELQELQV